MHQKKDRLRFSLAAITGWTALMLMLLAVLFIYWISWPFIVQWQGVGVYSVVFYCEALVVTGIMWLVSFYYYRNKRLALAYWLTCFLPLPVFVFMPAWFQAPTLS